MANTVSCFIKHSYAFSCCQQHLSRGCQFSSVYPPDSSAAISIKDGEKQMPHILFLPFCFPSATRIAHLGRTHCVESNSFQKLPQLSGIESNNEIGQDRSLKKKKKSLKSPIFCPSCQQCLAESAGCHISPCFPGDTFSKDRVGITQLSAIAPSPQHLTAFAFL